MESSVRVIELIAPVTNLCLNKHDVQQLEYVQPDVEFMLLESVQLYLDSKYEECVDALQSVIDITWEQLNTGHWSLVPIHERAIYSASSLLKVVALVQQAMQSTQGHTLSYLEKAVRTADMGLLLGSSYRDRLSTAAQILSQAINCYKPSNSSSEVRAMPETPKLQVTTHSVRELHCPSIESFSIDHFYPRLPVKLKGCMSHWPALHRWTDLNYLQELCGNRTVPVELGSSYNNEDWSQQLMPLRQFISQYIQNPTQNTPVGYLAQHQLFDQIPELRRDIAVPDYCACSEEEQEVDINAWFGPGGTVSPLHYDPKHNLLCQVVGKKRIVLYPPAVSECLYPNKGRLLSNTARVNPEDPDYSMFPMFHGVEAIHCELGPGDMLYIPPTWWHHVRALDLSFSVSFWWV